MSAPNDQMATVPDDGPLPIRKQKFDEAHFDITAMIDLVFMMNIFFLVTSIASSMADLDLPPAKHVKAADLDRAVVVSIVDAGDGQPALVRLEDGGAGELMPEGSEQDAKLDAALEAGMSAGKNVLLIKAERGILHRDVARVAALAANHEGMKLNLAVLEYDSAQ
jgi:biopolymer transport protein ExbD